MPAPALGQLLRLTDAGDAKPAWVTLLTTEQYNLQTQRAATITETNGRASIFLGAVSAALVALGFQASHGRSGTTTAFQAVVLSTLVFLGAVTFLRCLETALDDWQFSLRITALRAAYAQLVPELGRCRRVGLRAERAPVAGAAGRGGRGVRRGGGGRPLPARTLAGCVGHRLLPDSSRGSRRQRGRLTTPCCGPPSSTPPSRAATRSASTR